eukprot:tig00000430_g653.t1
MISPRSSSSGLPPRPTSAGPSRSPTGTGPAAGTPDAPAPAPATVQEPERPAAAQPARPHCRCGAQPKRSVDAPLIRHSIPPDLFPLHSLLARISNRRIRLRRSVRPRPRQPLQHRSRPAPGPSAAQSGAQAEAGLQPAAPDLQPSRAREGESGAGRRGRGGWRPRPGRDADVARAPRIAEPNLSEARRGQAGQAARVGAGRARAVLDGSYPVIPYVPTESEAAREEARTRSAQREDRSPAASLDGLRGDVKRWVESRRPLSASGELQYMSVKPRTKTPPVSAAIEHHTQRYIVGRSMERPQRLPPPSTFGRKSYRAAWGEDASGYFVNSMTGSAHSATEDRENQAKPCAVDFLEGTRVVSAAAGRFHSLLVTDEGALFACGLDVHGQLGAGEYATDGAPKRVRGELEKRRVRVAAAGAQHSAAVTDVGELLVWGHNAYGQLGFLGHGEEPMPRRLALPDAEPAAGAALGERHSLFLTRSGKIYAAGQHSCGQLGVGSSPPAQRFAHELVPVSMPYGAANVGIRAVACGSAHSVALAHDGSVWAWGNGEYGQLGLGTTGNKDEPARVEALAGVHIAGIACGSQHTVAHSVAGKCYTWGQGSYGATGLGTEASQLVPRPVGGALEGKQVTSVAAGAYHTLVLVADRHVYAFGRGQHGELGVGSWTVAYEPRRVERLSGKGVVFVTAGGSHSFAATVTGRLYSFGLGAQGQLGLVSSPLVPVAGYWPTAARAHKRVVSVACGLAFTLALTDTGEVWSWGNGEFGALGLGTGVRELRLEPQPLRSLWEQRVVRVAAGGQHAAALTEAGRLFVWGSNLYGCLGLGHCEDVEVPVPLERGPISEKRVTAVALGSAHTAAITADGEVWAWGRVEGGATQMEPAPVEASPPRPTHVSCGAASIAVLTADGQVWIWSSRVAFREEELESWAAAKPAASAAALAAFAAAAASPTPRALAAPGSPSGKDALPRRGSNVTSAALKAIKATLSRSRRGSQAGIQLAAATERVQLARVELPGGARAASLACGSRCFVAASDQGEVFTWGVGAPGQLGHGKGGSSEAAEAATAPRRVEALAKVHVSSVAAGHYICMALSDGGTSYVWGSGVFGGLGNGKTQNLYKPTRLTTLKDVAAAAVSSGGGHSMLVSDGGQLYGWGNGSSGQLGFGGQKNEGIPKRLPLTDPGYKYQPPDDSVAISIPERTAQEKVADTFNDIMRATSVINYLQKLKG